LNYPRDSNDAAAHAWRTANPRETFVTTDYVIAETLTLFRVRRLPRTALAFGEDAFRGAIGDVKRVSEAEIESAWEVFRAFSDKEWSFIDCLSYVAMERWGIRTAFAFDQHVRQFGTVDVVPQ
jgi:predicted nucleic acid-binding protein